MTAFNNTLERPGPIMDGHPTVAGPVTWMDGAGVWHHGYPPPGNVRWVPSANGVYVMSSGKTEVLARRLNAAISAAARWSGQHVAPERGENRHARRARAARARRA